MHLSLSAQKHGILGISGHAGCGHAHSNDGFVQDDSGGLAAVTTGGKAGFIDENGDWAFSPVYDEVRAFSGGFGWGKTGGAWYILEY